MKGGTGSGRCAPAVRGAGQPARSWPARASERARHALGTVPLTAGPGDRRDRVRRGVKRALDILVASALLVLALPLLFAIAVAVRVESPGPVFYRARRAGHGSGPVDVLKFRKMRHGAAGPALTERHDSRLTHVGAVLVRTHLDELPQLWNVLVGQMSLVGPRPEDARFAMLHPRAYEAILSVRPGLTGTTQLVCVDECDLLATARDRTRFYVDELLPRKVQLDVAYAARPRLWTDAKVLLWTPLVLVFGFAVTVDEVRQELRLVRPGGASRQSAAPPVAEAVPALVDQVAG